MSQQTIIYCLRNSQHNHKSMSLSHRKTNKFQKITIFIEFLFIKYMRFKSTDQNLVIPLIYKSK